LSGSRLYTFIKFSSSTTNPSMWRPLVNKTLELPYKSEMVSLGWMISSKILRVENRLPTELRSGPILPPMPSNRWHDAQLEAKNELRPSSKSFFPDGAFHTRIALSTVHSLPGPATGCISNGGSLVMGAEINSDRDIRSDSVWGSVVSSRLRSR